MRSGEDSGVEAPRDTGSARDRMVLRDLFPGILRRFAPDFFERTVGRERYATCEHCGADDGRGMSGSEGVSVATRCCTYFPRVANFLIGDLLADDSAVWGRGRDIMRGLIREGASVAPAGSRPSPGYLSVRDGLAPGWFGRAEEVKCPFAGSIREGCLIWPYRDEFCRTYYCLYEEGMDGRAFWHAFRDYLGWMTASVARHALREIGMPPDGDAWGSWRGREEEVYLACRQAALSLSPDRIPAILGARGEELLDGVRRRFHDLENPRVPGVLRFGSKVRVDGDGEGRFMLRNDLGTFRVSGDLYRAIRSFDGSRDVGRRIAEIRGRESLVLTPGLVLRLYRQRILEEPGDSL